MLDNLIGLLLYFGSVCAGVLAMVVISRWTDKDWPRWIGFFVVTGLLMAWLQHAGVTAPV